MDAIHTEVKTLGHHLSRQLDFLIEGDTECPWLFVGAVGDANTGLD